jgi:hypothetical protein
MSAAQIEYPHRTRKRLNWPESIDMDRQGNLYVSDTLAGSLYRLRRRADGTLDSSEELILSELKSAHAVSIGPEDTLYLGVTVRVGQEIESRIIALPPDLLAGTDLPHTYEALKAHAAQQGYPWRERVLPPGNPPNGVVFAERNHSVYYTVERLWPGLLGRKGHLASVSFDADHQAPEILKRVTPNGIDVDSSAEELTLVLALSFKHAVCRIRLSPGREPQVQKARLGSGRRWPFGHIPDGLICLENGDVLVACFGSGKVLCLPREGSAYGRSCPVCEGLGCPTDLVCGQSSGGRGTSLFVTTMKPLFKGRLIEIPDIQGVIEAQRQHAV